MSAWQRWCGFGRDYSLWHGQPEHRRPLSLCGYKIEFNHYIADIESPRWQVRYSLSGVRKHEF